MSRPLRIINVVGARPNFMKIAPLMVAYAQCEAIDPLLVHSGQHYDTAMSERFFRDLGIPEPDVNLEVGSESHAVQTAEIMKAFERVVLDQAPDAVVVVGDVNSTIACGLVAVKLGVPLAHVEAGLRSGDRTMPEEINRILTDAISDLHFCTEQAGVDNLAREGVDPGRVHLVGNLMIDTLLRHRQRANSSEILETLGLGAGEYAVLTLHRPSNVDDGRVLAGILDAIHEIQLQLPVVLPLHPRTGGALARFGLESRLEAMRDLRILEPLGYLDFLKLMSDARIVFTDSGGIQEETTILQVPCLTLRENTERPVTVEVGTNRLVGMKSDDILEGFHTALTEGSERRVPPLWDGESAARIVDVLVAKVAPKRV